MRARTQLTVAATAVAALLVALTGQFLVWRLDHRDRADLDRALIARADRIRADATRTGKLPADGVYAVRLMTGDQVRAQSGSTVRFSSPVTDGYSTVAGDDGQEYRSWAETLPAGVRLQVLTSLTDVRARHADAVRLVDLSVLVAIVLGGLASWFAGGVLLRPLRRLQEGAGELSPDDLSGRLPGVSEPREVADVTASVNAMLDRMQAAAGTPAAPAGKFVLPLALPAVSTVTPPPAVPDTFPPRKGPLALPAAPSAPDARRHGADRNGADKNGADKNGADKNGADKNGADQSAADKNGADQSAADQNGADRSGADRSGADWNGADPDAADLDTAGWAAGDRDDQALRDALAKLGDDLDALLDNPELSATQRHLLLAGIQNEYHRIVLFTQAADRLR